MAPITWRNVNAPNFSDSLTAVSRAGRDLGGALQGIGGAIEGYAKDRSDRETAAFISDLNNAPDDATRAEMIANAERAFLDLNQVNKAQRSAELHDFARAGEERALDAAARDEVRFQDQLETNALTRELRTNQDARSASAEARAVKAEGRAATTFQNQQDDRARQLATENLVSTGLTEVDNLTNPSARFARLKQIATDAAQNNLRISPADRKLINERLATTVDRIPVESVVNIPQYTNAFQQFALQSDAQGNISVGQMSAGQLDQFKALIRQQVAQENPNMSGTIVDSLTSRALAKIPAYSQQRRIATQQSLVQAGSDKSAVDEAVGISQWVNQLKAAKDKTGVEGVVRKFLRSHDSVDFSNEVISDQDLNTDVSSVMDALERLYPGKLDAADKGRVIMALSARSHVDEFALGGFSDVQFSHGGKTYDWQELAGKGDTDADNAFKAVIAAFLPK